MHLTERLTQANLLQRIAWAYAIYVILVLAAFAAGYFLLPEGALRGTPYTALGEVAGQGSPLGQFLATVAINLVFAFGLGVLMNVQRVQGLPAGYLFLFAAGVVSGLVAGSNSFSNPVISPYSLEGWLIALRIQHLELLGYAVIVAATIDVVLREYSSWLPWAAKETAVKGWRAIRLSRHELLAVIAGIALILLAGYNETVLVM